VGFGTELLLVLLLGFLILGPKQMHTMLGHLARAKTEFDKATRAFKSHLAADLEAPLQGPKDENPPRTT
jgi:Sec-independent protein translocase protein TatA